MRRPEPSPPRRRNPRLGVAMAAGAGLLWALNGAVAKVVLASGVSSLRLAQVRSTGACAGLALVVAATAPGRLRVRARELPFLCVFGVAGLAFVQWFYFLAIHRLALGIALLLQYTAPLLVALWARFGYGHVVRRRIWVSLALALAGLALIVNVGGNLSSTGILFAAGGAVTYALYVLLAEREVGRRDALSLLAWGFFFATLFWCVIAPWWSFPAGRIDNSVSLLGHLSGVSLPVWGLLLWVVVPGTIVPFVLLVSALRHLPSTRVGIVAMLEPVAATAIAWVWLGESLGPAQLAGAAAVLAAIAIAQTAR